LSLLALIVGSIGCKKDGIDNDTSFLSSAVTANPGKIFDISTDNSGNVKITPTGEGASSYVIQFGHGTGTSASAEVKPGSSATHAYPEGSYTVTIVSKSLSGKETSTTYPLQVTYRAPENLNVTTTQDVHVLKVKATALYAASYLVYFGDVVNETGTPLASGAEVSHTYASAGTYNLKVVALSGGAAKTEKVTPVTIYDAFGLPITFDLSTINYFFGTFGDGQQFVAYGMHPKGMDYEWIGDGDPATVPLADLPEVTPQQLIELNATVGDLLTERGDNAAACGFGEGTTMYDTVLVLGDVKVPLNTPDFSSFLLQAQASKAKIIGLANAGGDTINSIKQGAEFGIAEGGQKFAGLLIFNTDVHSLGLKTAQGLQLTAPFYNDLNDEMRAWSARFEKRFGRPPSFTQAGVYSAIHHYLNAVKALNSKDPDKVMEKMRATPINDFMTKNGKLREDGRVMRDMYLFEVKKPSESKGEWDLLKLLQTVPGDQAFRPIDKGDCPLVKKG